MKISSFQYTEKEGWSIKSFPKLDSENTLIIAFSAPDLANKEEIIKELSKHYPKSKMIGCSSAGEIFGSLVLDKSLSIAIVQFEKTRLKIVQAPIKSIQNSYEAGTNIAKQLEASDLAGIFVLSDGLHVNGTELAKGLNVASKNKQVTITGGLAGDGPNFKDTWNIYNGEIVYSIVVAVGLYGDKIQIGHASKGGWDIFGPERIITRSEGSILYELDGRPALELYKEYLGDKAADLPASGLLYPLTIRRAADDSKQLVRTILAVDEQTQSLTFAGDMPAGYLAQLMRANFERLISSAGEAGEEALRIKQTSLKSENANPILCVAISCVGRRLLLGERTEEETESLLETLPPGTHQVGFYSYGELSPYTAGSCDLHNQTMTITTFSEG